MTGFFKKLFNRITGKKEEPPPQEQPAQLTEPETATAPPEPAVEPSPPEPEPAAGAVREIDLAEPLPDEAPEPEPAPEVEVPTEPVVIEAPQREAPTAVEPEPVEEEAPAPEAKPKAKAKEPTAKAAPKAKKATKPKPEAKPPVRRKKAEAQPQAEEVAAPVVEAPPEPKPSVFHELPPAREVPAPAPVERPQPFSFEPSPEPEPPPPPPKPKAALRPEPKPQPPAPPPEPAKGWFARLKDGLSKSSKSLSGSITAIFTKRKLDAATLEELEDTLIQADLGLTMAERIIKAVSLGRFDKEIEPDEVRRILASEVEKVLKPVEIPFTFGAEKPYVILVVGVNGSGKTTTIGKLGAIASAEGFKVMLAACDTFRAAAIEQLTIWGGRIGAKTMSRPTGADAAGLAFDAMQEARADGTDILFIDTAGRLQNKANLMAELEKVVRVLKKQDETAPHAVLLVLDATTGQNAISQADVFTKVAGVTGLIMTKLDGTARGGILVAIAEKFKLPVHAIGVGEAIDDLQPFDAQAFSRAIAGLEQ